MMFLLREGVHFYCFRIHSLLEEYLRKLDGQGVPILIICYGSCALLEGSGSYFLFLHKEGVPSSHFRQIGFSRNTKSPSSPNPSFSLRPPVYKNLLETIQTRLCCSLVAFLPLSMIVKYHHCHHCLMVTTSASLFASRRHLLPSYLRNVLLSTSFESSQPLTPTQTLICTSFPSHCL